MEHNYLNNSRVASTYRVGGASPKTLTSESTDSHDASRQTLTSESTDSQGPSPSARRVRVHSGGRTTTDTDKNQTTTQTHTQTTSAGGVSKQQLFTSGRGSIDFGMGGDFTTTENVVSAETRTKNSTLPNASVYRYNKFAGKCCICDKEVTAGGGTLLLDKAVEKMRPAHHFEECRSFLTEQEQADHLKGLVNTVATGE